MKELILDYSKWRCGGSGTDICNNILGEGNTMMLNSEGFSCCLGQFAPQINPEITDDILFQKGTPAELNYPMPGFNNIKVPIKWLSNNQNTTLSNRLMNINDNSTTNPEYKLKLIEEELLSAGYQLKVINKSIVL